MTTYLGSLVQLSCEEHKQILMACVGNAHSLWTTLSLPKPKVACTFWIYTAQTPWYSARALSQVDPAFHDLPTSKQLRFSVLCKGKDPDGLCVLCPSWVRAAQSTGFVVSALSPVGCASYHLPGPGCLVSQVCHESTVPGV